ncbi:hypothetical protein J4G48_0031655 [Bradyrhizobium barranii subsp. apii]|uniref:hypothetical protein n=1 Tax=Bradyrhizobium barranii TaxID=2992140 RepID=UPI001CD4903B|nr:hypothetical protein [Bradyrhizobium barranii]UPT93868.1 hypothetical protein J4G48_0031655 [Bradyrhizobium barranii subsp. apii]
MNLYFVSSEDMRPQENFSACKMKNKTWFSRQSAEEPHKRPKFSTTSRTEMIHHNDNQRTPEEHRRILAQQRAAQDNTREVRFRNQHWPTFGRLKRADAWREIQALERFAADEGVSLPEGNLHAANDNSPADDTGRTEISRIDARLGEEVPDGDDIMAAWFLDEEDRKEGRPEKANRILYGANNQIIAVKIRGKYRSLEETFAEPRGPAEDKAKVAAAAVPDELPDAQDDAARRMDHIAMKRRLGREVFRVLELALGTLTSEEIGEDLGLSSKSGERMAVKLVDGAIVKLMAEYARRDTADREAA